MSLLRIDETFIATDIKRMPDIADVYFEDCYILFDFIKTAKSLNFHLSKLLKSNGFNRVTIFLPKDTKADEALISALALRGCRFHLMLKATNRSTVEIHL